MENTCQATSTSLCCAHCTRIFAITKLIKGTHLLQWWDSVFTSGTRPTSRPSTVLLLSRSFTLAWSSRKTVLRRNTSLAPTASRRCVLHSWVEKSKSPFFCGKIWSTSSHYLWHNIKLQIYSHWAGRNPRKFISGHRTDGECGWSGHKSFNQ